ncbi:MAG TPA: EAL domain-containing protein, partial [Burkholderiaceae bacterium]|nr:EAL domain-containing protein [Burkholderiaceae bacterium]
LVALAIAGFVAWALAMDQQSIERAAQLEAEHVARTLVPPGMGDAIHKSQALQALIDRVHADFSRDAFVVDLHKITIADAEHADIGKIFNQDLGDEIARTMADGQPRAFREQSLQYPEPAMQVAVPLYSDPGDPRSPIVGAVVLEYTPIYRALRAAERGEMLAIAVGGLVCILFSTLFGWKVAARLAGRIKALQRGVAAIDAGQSGVQVSACGKDEVASLAGAFNRMAAELDRSHAALREHGEQLEHRVEQRTLELSQANALLAQEARERQLAAQRIEFLAYYDGLTGLPNRTLFARLLEQGISQAKRSGKRLALLFVDLDRFKQINDTLGHDAGDQLLEQVAQRLKACLRESDAVARLGGDEFVVMLTELGEESRAATVAEKVLGAVSRGVTLNAMEFRITASVGISTYPDHGTDESELMKHADIAMYRAKEDGRNLFRFYNAQLNTSSLERLALESSLRRALERNELRLHYQPKVDSKQGAVIGVEALLRWQHPDLGVVPPAKFIPIAEETGLIVPIGEWVLRAACEQHVRWYQAGLPPVSVAVNLSPRQFGDELLLETVESVLTETGMEPARLQLEITESTLMQNPKSAVATLMAFKKIGVRLAIDDFGTGYSSLASLKLFPVDTIKVDRSFIRDLAHDTDDQGIVDAIIAMGRALGLTVVAEGVETREQVEFLGAHQCDQFQGFYFSKPVPASELAELLGRPASASPLVAALC